MNKQTAMQQLLNQLKDERVNLPMDIEWDRCYQAIEMVIANTYLPIEKQQIIDVWLSAWKDSMLNPLEDKYYQPEAEQYYNETYGDNTP